MRLHSIDLEQRLYVMPCGDGYSCYGFDVLDRQARAVAAWSKQLPPIAAVGTPEHFRECAAIMDAGALHAAETGTRCNADLTPQLVGLEGKRVEIVDSDGERHRFYVGKSSGWLPIHLAIARRNSTGGCGAPLGVPYRSVRVVGSR